MTDPLNDSLSARLNAATRQWAHEHGLAYDTFNDTACGRTTCMRWRIKDGHIRHEFMSLASEPITPEVTKKETKND